MGKRRRISSKRSLLSTTDLAAAEEYPMVIQGALRRSMFEMRI